MHQPDCVQWITEAFDKIPWDNSPTLKCLIEKYGPAFKQRLRDLVVLPLLGYTSVRDAEDDLPYGRDVVYEWLKLPGIDWSALVEEITFAIFFYWLEHGLNHDPSTLSRNRLRLIFDHTLIRKWGRTIAAVANLFDHVTGAYHWSHKLVVGFVTVGDNRFRFPLAVRLWNKRAAHRKTHSELAAEICWKLHQEARKRDISLSSVRVLADKDYCTKPVVTAVRRAGMTLYGSPQPTHKFVCKGQMITTADLKCPTFALPWRSSSKLRTDHPLHRGRYARLLVEHPDLGSCVLVVAEYVHTKGDKLERHVYLCTDPLVDSVRVVQEARRKRWPVEVQFRQSKQTRSYQCYQGAQESANHAHYACGVLRSLLLEHLLKLSRRKPTLSQSRRMANASQTARYLSRNARFTDIYKCEEFQRLRRGSLNKAAQNPEKRALTAA